MMAHASSTRLALRKGRGEKCICLAEAIFQVVVEGVNYVNLLKVFNGPIYGNLYTKSVSQDMGPTTETVVSMLDIYCKTIKKIQYNTKLLTPTAAKLPIYAIFSYGDAHKIAILGFV